MSGRLTVLSVYNRYLNRGGEDEVFEAEAELLRRYGNRVILITESVSPPEGILRSAAMAVNSLWSQGWAKKFRRLLANERVDVVHVHNFFPVISPSIFYACRAHGTPVVQTLHNYRLVCPAALLFRAGRPCEDCVGRKLAWPGALHGCYRGSRGQSGVVMAMLGAHNFLGTWKREVTLYIALTEFSRAKFVQGGLPPEKVIVKPNFLSHDPALEEHRDRYALFVGRLSAEKGIEVLLEASARLGGEVPIKIVGDGPLTSKVTDHANQAQNLCYLGRKPRSEVLALMRKANFLVVPSQWYETSSLVTLEAFATGLPVIVAGHGALVEIVDHGRTGLHFRPGDPDDLAAKVEWAWTHPREMADMGRQARLEYEQKYTAERNYQMLMDIYDMAIARARH